jgi:hypothetical protein
MYFGSLVTFGGTYCLHLHGNTVKIGDVKSKVQKPSLVSRILDDGQSPKAQFSF